MIFGNFACSFTGPYNKSSTFCSKERVYIVRPCL